MKRSRLLLSVVFFVVGVRDSFEECLLQSIKGELSYVCGSITELEQEGNRGLFNVVIHKYKSPPDENKTPNLQLTLVENDNEGITNNTFKLLKDIQKLFTNTKEAITIPAGLLSHLRIQDLKLQRNGIVDIEPGSFNNVQGFKKLHITDNKLSEVKAGIFNNLPLDTLALSNNRISFIEKSSFMNMTRLRRLYLDGNRLEEFQPEVLMDNPQKLEILHLQNNTFTEIDRNMLRGLNNLKTLNLHNNKITQIASYTFDQLLNLEKLILSNNLLVELNPEIFPRNGLQKLEKFQINNNHLSYLTTTALERLRNLKSIGVVGNPWQCPCLDAISTWLGDHDVQEKCNSDYNDGTRPICVADESHPNTCVYINKETYFRKYNEINKQSPPTTHCEL